MIIVLEPFFNTHLLLLLVLEAIGITGKFAGTFLPKEKLASNQSKKKEREKNFIISLNKKHFFVDKSKKNFKFQTNKQ